MAATSANESGGADPATLADCAGGRPRGVRGRRRRRRAAGNAVDGDRLHRPRARRRSARAPPRPPTRSTASARRSAAEPVDPRGPAGGGSTIRSNPEKELTMAIAQETFEHLRTAGLAEIDPDIAELLGRELERQRGQIELIASENFTWPSVLEAVGSTPTNKYAEGYPGQALLRRLRGRRRDRGARAHPRQGALRRRARERPAARRRAGEHGGLLCRAQAGRPDARALARPRRATSRTASRSTSPAACTRCTTTASRARR